MHRMNRAASWPVILLCGSLVIALAMGVRQVTGLFLRPVALDIGLSREAFGMAVAIQNLVWGLAQPIAGLIADRFGARPVALVCGTIYAAGIALAAAAGDALTFTLGLGVLGGIGQAGTTHAVILALIGRAAPPGAQGLAMGLGSTASSAGMFVMVPVVSLLIDQLDWRGAMMVMACMLAATPLIALTLRESVSAGGGAGMPPVSAGAALTAAMADRDYWLINLGFATCGFQLAFLTTFLPAILSDAGLAASAGAAVLATIGLVNIPGTYLSSLAGTRWPKSRTLAAMYVLRATAMLLFLALPVSTASAIAFGAAIGLLWTGTVPVTSALVAGMWGRRNLGLLFGVVYIGHQCGSFLGAWLSGWVYDHTGSFTLVWALAIGLSVTAATCHLLLRERPRALALRESAA